jgi:hypothetical protein
MSELETARYAGRESMERTALVAKEIAIIPGGHADAYLTGSSESSAARAGWFRG